MKKLLSALLICGLTAASAVSCAGKTDDTAEEENAVSAVSAAADENAAGPTATTLSPMLAEAMEKGKDNLKKSIEKAKSQHPDLWQNTDEMDAEAKKVVNKFAEGAFGDDAEAMAEAMYPAKMLESMKSCGEYDSFAESVTDGEAMPLTSVYVKFCVKLKDNEKELAESYINYYAKQYGLSEDEYTVTDGYSFSADMESRTEHGGSSSMEQLIIINIQNEGWKIIPISLKELTE